MDSIKPWQSVVTRLVLCLLLGGLLISACVGLLEWQRSRREISLQVSKQTVLVVRDLQSSIAAFVVDPKSTEGHIERQFQHALTNPLILSFRVQGPELQVITKGDDSLFQNENHAWQLGQYINLKGNEIDLSKLTHVSAPFLINGKRHVLEAIIDGPGAWGWHATSLWYRITTSWLLLGVIILLGLLLLKRWFVGPLLEINRLVHENAPPRAFNRHAEHYNGEFQMLAMSIGNMMSDVEDATQKLERNEHSVRQLYLQAPTALISLDLNGYIERANERAAKLFGLTRSEDLVGKYGYDFVHEADRALLKESIARLAWESSRRSELRLQHKSRAIEVNVDAVGVRDELGALCAVRLALIDVSQSKHAFRQLEDSSRLLNLVIDHMSDAILLVDKKGKVVTVNQRMCNLLHRPAEMLRGTSYKAEYFWDQLGILDQEAFFRQIKQIEIDSDRSAQERFEAAGSTYLFKGTPVRDGLGNYQGRMWTISEVVDSDNNRLANEHNHRLLAVKQVGYALAKARTVDELLDVTVKELCELFNVEAVGVAIRHGEVGQRSKQVIYRGRSSNSLQSNRKLIDVIETGLMPEILANPEFAYWPDLDLSKGFWPNDHKRAGWRCTFSNAGFTSLTVGPLLDNIGAGQGLVWIAQRAGEHFERHHLLLIEMITPIIEARLEMVQLKESLVQLDLTDAATDLPKMDQITRAANQWWQQSEPQLAVLSIEIDHYDHALEVLGQSTADALLREVGVNLQNTIRRSCLLARNVGATFVVLAPEMNSTVAMQTAERLCQHMGAKPIDLGEGREYPVTLSVGVASSEQHYSSFDHLLDAAHICREKAQRHGRNCVVSDIATPDAAAG
ncbi:sensor domain-containing diguanylate cyclase [Poriferisphaera sp. WC338]|uniref:sensor domain-containing diguanylate cyclase n=1 Tax=Poriferisphaera sp. WC338 TaxID=3425129 RepID=UPI003D8158E7